MRISRVPHESSRSVGTGSFDGRQVSAYESAEFYVGSYREKGPSALELMERNIRLTDIENSDNNHAPEHEFFPGEFDEDDTEFFPR